MQTIGLVLGLTVVGWIVARKLQQRRQALELQEAITEAILFV